MNNIIKALGLVGLTTLAGVGNINLSRKQPFKMDDVAYQGYKNDKGTGARLLYFGDREAGVVDRSRNFDFEKTEVNCNVSGYTQYGTTYATSTVPVRVTSD
jgi:hypothetical protein